MQCFWQVRIPSSFECCSRVDDDDDDNDDDYDDDHDKDDDVEEEDRLENLLLKAQTYEWRTSAL
jgi:hypothetical protein